MHGQFSVELLIAAAILAAALVISVNHVNQASQTGTDVSQATFANGLANQVAYLANSACQNGVQINQEFACPPEGFYSIEADDRHITVGVGKKTAVANIVCPSAGRFTEECSDLKKFSLCISGNELKRGTC